jgi:outer membrane protein
VTAAPSHTMRPALSRTLLAAVLAAAAPAARAAPALTLDQALELAARHNADLLVAGADADSARADVSTARSGVLPRLDLSTSAGHTYWGASSALDLGAGYTVPEPAGNAAAYALGLQASQPLLDLGRLRALSQARQGLRAAERQREEVALSIAFVVTQRFYDLVKQERSLEVLEKTAGRSQELVGRADALYVAGRSPKSDTYGARVNLGNDRIATEGQRARVAQARTALAAALGSTDPEAVEVVAPPELDAGSPAAEPPPLEALLQAARERRPNLLAGSARLDAARAAVEVARAGYLPTVALQGSYSRTSAQLTGRDGAYGDPSRAYTATGQVVLSWNLFQGFATDADVRRAEAGLARSAAGAQGDQAKVAEEVASARAAVMALARQEALAVENLQAARDALRLATDRFGAGLATQLEERDASLKLSQAELTLLETRIDHAVARADLARAVGGSL